MQRALLLIGTNLAVMLVLSVTASLLGVNQWMTAGGLQLGSLLIFCLLFGFGGAFFSLLISKWVAKKSTGATVITGTEGATEQWLVQVVAELSQKAGIAMPEVAVYEGPPNAFATGPSKNSALVAVSTGLLQTMDRKQVEAVLAHEVAHAANNDLVTLTLIQGVVNTFVMFLARIVGYVVDRVILKNEDEAPGIGYTVSVVALDLLFGVLASIIVAYFSRGREFRADEGAAALMGTNRHMISALQALAQHQGTSAPLPSNMRAFGISGGKSILALFASHPPLEERIAALQQVGGN